MDCPLARIFGTSNQVFSRTNPWSLGRWWSLRLCRFPRCLGRLSARVSLRVLLVPLFPFSFRVLLLLLFLFRLPLISPSAIPPIPFSSIHFIIGRCLRSPFSFPLLLPPSLPHRKASLGAPIPPGSGAIGPFSTLPDLCDSVAVGSGLLFLSLDSDSLRGDLDRLVSLRLRRSLLLPALLSWARSASLSSVFLFFSD